MDRRAVLIALSAAIAQMQLCAAGPKPETLKASAYNLALEPYALIVDAGKEQDTFRRNGLDPQWISREGRAIMWSDLQGLVAQGTHIGLSSPFEIFVARAHGVPLKVVAGFIGDTTVRVYAKADGPIRTAKDLDGKRIGPTSHAIEGQVVLLSRAFAIQATGVPFASLEHNITALREGRIDAIITADSRILAHVESGELRLLMSSAEYRPRPELNNCVWATEELIQKNPDLVGSFVRATLQTVQYLKDNPRAAARLISARSNLAETVAYRAALLFDWMPSGQPGGDLMLAAKNYWQFRQAAEPLSSETKLTIEEVVDTRFVAARQ